MDGPSGSTRRASPWNIPSPTRRHMNPSAGSPPAPTTNAAEASASTRSPTTPSRRRRVFGRLTRSSSDVRSTALSEAQDFVSAAITTRPSKRKAQKSPKASKPVPRRPSVDHLPMSNTDPPLIRSEDVLPSTQIAPGMSGAFSAAVQAATSNEILLSELRAWNGDDTSDDEADVENYDLVVQAANYQAPDPPIRRGIFPSRRSVRVDGIRGVEDLRRQRDTARTFAAVLVTPDAPTLDPSLPGTVSERLRYLPLCPSNIQMSRSESGSSRLLTVLPSHCDFVQRLSRGEEPSSAVWPTGALPVELFDLITAHLARDDVKALRLVNREFEQKVSRSLFHTAVVPFNTEIYDMIDDERKTNNRPSPSMSRPKGKTKALTQDEDDRILDLGGLQWENAKEDKEGKVYKGHGLRVFRGFGPHIKRFGMSFEVSEKQLSRPPVKKELDHIEAYHGSYDWPSENYARFATLAGLENAADETSRMKAAFSNLEIVQELALSLDSGLGWLNGPDKSLRATIFEQPNAVFGSSYHVPDHATKAADDFWVTLQQSQAAFDPRSNPREMTLEYRPSLSDPTEIDGLRDNIYSNVQLWATLDSNRLTSVMTTPFAGLGVFYTLSGQQRAEESLKFSLMPGSLSKEQREWLLETQWAQQAFLESYMLAVIDNPATFANVTTLNFANVSSRFLPMLAREVFWERLPQLSDVILRVNADWRTVDKDDAGFAQTTHKLPSDAARFFHKDILLERIAPRQSIKNLTIGWIGGGEHAEGIFARNNNLLPAPLTRADHCTANRTVFGAVFDHVEHLTLSNCWISPPVLEGLIKQHANKALKKLTLDSVSLTAHPKFPLANLLVPAPAAAAVNPAAGAGAQAAPPPPLPPHLNANPQHMAQWQQQMTQWQQQFQLVQQQAQQFQQFALPNPAQAPNANPVLPLANQMPAQPTLLAANAPPPGHWAAGHREGSWPDILNIISPGTVFNDYLPAHQPWDEPLPPRPESNLRILEFKSCGYAKLLLHTGFDQSHIESRPRYPTSHWFRARRSNLKTCMMATSDRNVGQIVQHVPQRELDAMQFAWGLTEGWEDQAKAAEAEYDGFAPGGTGRFSGVVAKGMALVGQRSVDDDSGAAEGLI